MFCFGKRNKEKKETKDKIKIRNEKEREISGNRENEKWRELVGFSERRKRQKERK